MNESLKLLTKITTLAEDRKLHEFKTVNKAFAVFVSENPLTEVENDFAVWVNQQDFRGERFFGRDLFKKFINPFQNLLMVARGKASGNGKASLALSEYPDSATFCVDFKIDLRMFPTLRQYKADITNGSLPQEVISFMQEAIPGYTTVLEKEVKSRVQNLSSCDVKVEYKGLDEIGTETVLCVKISGTLE